MNHIIIIIFQLCAKTTVVASSEFDKDRIWLNGQYVSEFLDFYVIIIYIIILRVIYLF